MTKKEKERDEAISKLREIVKPGDRIYTVLRHVSRSGMTRHIDLYKIDRDDEGNEWMRYLSGYAAAANGYTRTPDGALKVGGCGMDMGFALVYGLSRCLFRDGFDCVGEGCPASDHFNGDRDYSSHRHSDPGYALKQEWL